MQKGETERRCRGCQPVGKREVAELERRSLATKSEASDDNFRNRTVSSSDQNSLIVCGKVDNTNCDIIIDTGSDISIVHPDVLSGKKQEQISPASGCSLRTVTGEKAPIRGTVELTLSIGTTEVSHRMWVADIQDRCTLGMDFLEPHKCLLNLNEKVLQIGEEEGTFDEAHSEHPQSLLSCCLGANYVPFPSVRDTCSC